MTQPLPETTYLAFPFRVGPDGGETSGRAAHIREQIEQVVFTNPLERVMRPEFGAGARQLVFEPNNQALRELTKKRLQASLTDALQGEVDPKTLSVAVYADSEHAERLHISISYTLAAIGARETHNLTVNNGS